MTISGKPLTVGSLFSGIGGMDLGLERAGFQVVWQVEKDRHCRSVLRHRWPAVQLHEDVNHVGRSSLAPVDVICGGFPCQDLSVAGRRAGLGGERSGLWFQFLRVVSELAPRWVLIENVPGLRSSEGGRDLAVILRGLAQLGYVGAWRSLDSQHFGVAQRRERIFLLARRDSGDGSPAEILAIPEGLSGHPAPSREAGEGVAGVLEARTDGGGFPGTDGACGGHVVAPLRCAVPSQGGVNGDDEHVVLAGTLAAHGGLYDEKGQTFIAHTLRSEGHDASEDGTGRGVPLVVGYQQDVFCEPHGVAPALAHASNTHGGNHQPKILAFDWQKGNDLDNPRPSTMNLTAESPTLSGTRKPAVTTAVPRRLTPTECERLQGFPDGWTAWGIDEKGRRVDMADSPRYRMLGNAVTVNVARWIGKRLMTLEPSL